MTSETMLMIPKTPVQIGGAQVVDAPRRKTKSSEWHRTSPWALCGLHLAFSRTASKPRILRQPPHPSDTQKQPLQSHQRGQAQTGKPVAAPATTWFWYMALSPGLPVSGLLASFVVSVLVVSAGLLAGPWLPWPPWLRGLPGLPTCPGSLSFYPGLRCYKTKPSGEHN